jgi:hypothetical protein
MQDLGVALLFLMGTAKPSEKAKCLGFSSHQKKSDLDNRGT